MNQKRYMRRFLKKPREMSWRQLISELIQMNDKLDKYPPYAANQKLTELEMLEIAEFGAPQTWQKNMIAHNFDCATKSITEVIEFGERQETLESLSGPPEKKPRRRLRKTLKIIARAVNLTAPSPLRRQSIKTTIHPIAPSRIASCTARGIGRTTARSYNNK